MSGWWAAFSARSATALTNSMAVVKSRNWNVRMIAAPFFVQRGRKRSAAFACAAEYFAISNLCHSQVLLQPNSHRGAGKTQFANLRDVEGGESLEQAIR